MAVWDSVAHQLRALLVLTAIGTGAATGSLAGSTGSLVGTAAGTGAMGQTGGGLGGTSAGTGTATGTVEWIAPLTGYSYGGWAAGIVTLGWNANTEPDLVGYRVYIGTSSGVYNFSSAKYTSPVNVGLVTTYTFTELTGPTTYYFAITAFNSTGGESSFSSEISWFVPDYGTITGSLSNSTGVLTGSSAGIGQMLGVTWNVGELVGTSSGLGSISGFMTLGSAGALSGVIQSSGEMTGTLGGDGRLANTSLIGSSTVDGTLVGEDTSYAGTADGTSTADATLGGDSAILIGSGAGTSTGSATISGSGALTGGSSGRSPVVQLVVSQFVGVAQHKKRSPSRGGEVCVSTKR